MVSAGRHPKNAINKSLEALDKSRFVVKEIHSGHRWGMVTCRVCGDDVAVWSTPRVPEHNAAAIRRFASKHDHKEEHDDDV